MQLSKKASQQIRRISREKRSNFVQLVEISGLDPLADFRHTRLAGCDFRNCDLSGFDFTGSDLEDADFSGAYIHETVFDDEQLSLLSQQLSQPKPASLRLIEACSNGDLDLVEACLAEGADVDASFKGQIPLTAAAENAHTAIVAWLVGHGADPNMRLPKTGETALIKAASGGHTECVQELLKLGANIDARASDRSTALTRSVVSGKTPVVELLISRGASTQHKPIGKKTLLSLAIESNNRKIFLTILGQFEPRNKENKIGKNILRYAIKNGNKYIIQDIFKYGTLIKPEEIHFHSDLNRAISDVAKAGNLGAVRLLSELGAKFEETVASAAIEGSQVDVLNLVLHNMRQRTDAFWTHRLRLKTLFELAGQQKETDCLELLLRLDTNIDNYVDKYNQTLLMLACRNFNLEALKLLLDKSIYNINLVVDGNRTALDYSVERGDREIINLMRSYGALTREEWLAGKRPN